jgi:hypothetical protein
MNMIAISTMAIRRTHNKTIHQMTTKKDGIFIANIECTTYDMD